MKKVLLTLPDNIAGKLITKGFSAGFKSNGCFVLCKELKDLSVSDVEKFRPDIVFGYDYGFLYSGKMDLIEYLLADGANCNLVHYFGDIPDSKYAYGLKNELYVEFSLLSKTKNNIFSFVWDKSFENKIPNMKYLPMAVNTKVYKAKEDLKKYDITFVGRPLTDKRQELLAALIKRFGKRVNIFSYENHFLQSLDDMKEKQFLTDEEFDIYKSSYRGVLYTEQELADVYFNSKVNINIPIQGCSGINYRVFEVLASCGFLLTEFTEEIEKTFIVSKELETYTDFADLIDKTEFYLKNYDFAQKISIMGYADVFKKHSYTSRARTVLDNVYKKQYE